MNENILRIGKIRYTNCIPFYHGLEKEMPGLNFSEEVPVQINNLMHSGHIDIAPISSLEYLNRQNDYLLLPYLGICAERFSGSVILLSHKKIEDLNGCDIALSKESLSSSALLKILLKKKYGFENSFRMAESNPEQMLRDFPAALVIGDSALFYEPKEFVFKYDLSELWRQWTGKPFCFAVWAARRGVVEKNSAAVRFFLDSLQKTLLVNLMDLEKVVREALGLDIKDERFVKVYNYLVNLRFYMTPEILDGLQLFYQYANELGLAPDPHELEFFESEKSKV